MEVESTFDYFASTVAYLKRHGKPVAFYSDKHSIFRLYHQGATGRAKGLDSTRARSGRPQHRHHLRQHAAGQRARRADEQDAPGFQRLVKELRLRGISKMGDGNVRSSRSSSRTTTGASPGPSQSAHDAHRPLQAGEDLVQTFSWQEELGTMSRNLTVHLLQAGHLPDRASAPRSLPLGGSKRVQVHASGKTAASRSSARARALPYSIFDQNPHGRCRR